MYYIRKFSKKSNLFKIKSTSTVHELDADFIKNEMGTYDNTLSFWLCEDMVDIKNTIKAILLSTTSIEASQFIIIDSSIITGSGLQYSKNSGITGYKGFSDLHVDICNLTYEKLGVLLKIYKDTIDDKIYIPCYDKEDVKKMIQEVISDGLLDEENLNEHLRNSIQRYCKVS